VRGERSQHARCVRPSRGYKEKRERKRTDELTQGEQSDEEAYIQMSRALVCLEQAAKAGVFFTKSAQDTVVCRLLVVVRFDTVIVYNRFRADES
jgi:hypothetical protein